jgi:hypothetical protein
MRPAWDPVVRGSRRSGLLPSRRGRGNGS